ncbi:MAG TPA: hypothetical protein VHG89_02155 [Verrucomicrobiae bacterium]|nr:hypothetical protein [Verrucomicrobiae bacterium]
MAESLFGNIKRMQKTLSLVLLVGACVVSGCATWLTTTVKPPVQVTIGAFTHAVAPPNANGWWDWSAFQVAVTNISKSPVWVYEYLAHWQTDMQSYRAFVRKDASSSWNDGSLRGRLGDEMIELAPGAGLVFMGDVSHAYIGQQIKVEVLVHTSLNKSKVIVPSNEAVIDK